METLPYPLFRKTAQQHHGDRGTRPRQMTHSQDAQDLQEAQAVLGTGTGKETPSTRAG